MILDCGPSITVRKFNDILRARFDDSYIYSDNFDDVNAGIEYGLLFLEYSYFNEKTKSRDIPEALKIYSKQIMLKHVAREELESLNCVLRRMPK